MSRSLLERVKDGVDEVILAMNATVEGQTTAHYLMDLLGDMKVTRLAHGVPVGGELDYLDEGTLQRRLQGAPRALAQFVPASSQACQIVSGTELRLVVSSA